MHHIVTPPSSNPVSSLRQRAPLLMDVWKILRIMKQFLFEVSRFPPHVKQFSHKMQHYLLLLPVAQSGERLSSRANRQHTQPSLSVLHWPGCQYTREMKISGQNKIQQLQFPSVSMPVSELWQIFRFKRWLLTTMCPMFTGNQLLGYHSRQGYWDLLLACLHLRRERKSLIVWKPNAVNNKRWIRL